MTHISGTVTTTSRVPVLLKSFLFRNIRYTVSRINALRAQVSPSFPRSEISMVRLGTNSASVRIHHRL